MISGSVEVYRDWPDPAEIIGDSAVKFTLGYDGPLPSCTQSDNHTKEKHAIRKELSFQLAQLWQQEPALASRLKQFDKFQVVQFKGGRIVTTGRRSIPTPLHYSGLKFPLDGFTFVPLITAHNNLYCELDMLLLRDGDPGHVIAPGGDLDNRIKTLFDALRMPHTSAELGSNKPESADPFFCLLEDDCLITKVTVATQRKLRRRNEPSTHVELRIGVNVVARKVTD